MGRSQWPVRIGAVAAAAGWLISIGYIVREGGPASVAIGVPLALAVFVPVVAAILWVGRWAPAPRRLLWWAFAWGSGISTGITVVLPLLVEPVVEAVFGAGSMAVFDPLVSTPVSEEGLKGLFLLGLFLLRPRHVDGLVDSIVLTGVAAAGFALTENVLYLGRAVTTFLAAPAGDPAAAGSLIAGLGLRMLLVPFMHPLFTFPIAVGVAIAVAQRSRAVRTAAIVLGFVVAIGLHSLWDTTALVGASTTAVFQVYGYLLVPLFAVAVAVAVRARLRDRRVVAAELPGMAGAGWVPYDDVPELGALAGRRRRRAEVRRQHGRDAARALVEYQAAVTRLARLRDRMARGPVRDGQALHELRLRTLQQARDRTQARTPTAA